MFVQSRFFILGLWMSLLVLVVGCKSTSTEEPSPDYQLDASTQKGVVALTVSRSGAPGLELGSVVFRGIDNGQVIDISLFDLVGVQKPDDDQFVGKLQLFTVPAGRYEIDRYRLASNQRGHIRINRVFNVEAGKVNYLGNLDVFLKRGGSYRATIAFNFHNKFSRDFLMIKERYPQFKTTDFAFQFPQRKAN